MNKRNKKIYTAVLVLFVLTVILGASYAYFALRVVNNGNLESLSIKSKNLRLIYGDGNNKITAEKIYPGTVVASKTFTVTNQGEDTEYLVDLEDINVYFVKTTPFEDAGDTTTLSNDFVYTLTCSSNIDTCNGVGETVFPNNDAIVVTNKIKEGDIHSYTLTVTFKETNEDQNSEQNKGFNAIVNIKDIREFNPFTNPNTLAYKIVDNGSKNIGGTRLVMSTDSNIGSEFANIKYDETAIKTGTKSLTLFSSEQGRYFTYSTEYVIDEDTGTFDLVNPKICRYSSDNCIHDLFENGQTVYLRGYSTSSASSTSSTPLSSTNLNNIYLVTEAPASSSSSIRIYMDVLGPKASSDENIIALAEDEYGYSFFYRGDVTNNYVSYTDPNDSSKKMCFRIIRIKGNGDIRVILEDKNETCSANMDGDWKIGNYNIGYEKEGTWYYKFSFRNPVTDQSNALINRLKTYQSGLGSLLNKLSEESICFNDTAYSSTSLNSRLTNQQKSTYYSNKSTFYYDTYVRLNGTNKTATLNCTGDNIKKYPSDNSSIYVSLITVDEAVFAGIKVGDTGNGINYLLNDHFRNDGASFYTSSPAKHSYKSGTTSGDYIYKIDYQGTINYYEISWTLGVRPVFSLSKDVTVSGSGTLNDPYVIN